MSNEENECCKPNFYDLEDQINQCWTVKEDLSLIRKNVDHLLKESVLEDSLLGLEILIDLRFKKLFDVFEDIVHTQVLVKRGNEWKDVDEEITNDVESELLYDPKAIEEYFESKIKKPIKIDSSFIDDAKEKIVFDDQVTSILKDVKKEIDK